VTNPLVRGGALFLIPLRQVHKREMAVESLHPVTVERSLAAPQPKAQLRPFPRTHTAPSFAKATYAHFWRELSRCVRHSRETGFTLLTGPGLGNHGIHRCTLNHALIINSLSLFQEPRVSVLVPLPPTPPCRCVRECLVYRQTPRGGVAGDLPGRILSRGSSRWGQLLALLCCHLGTVATRNPRRLDQLLSRCREVADSVQRSTSP